MCFVCRRWVRLLFCTFHDVVCMVSGMRKGSQKKELHVILKKVRPNSEGAAEMHDAEIHMNRRVQVPTLKPTLSA